MKRIFLLVSCLVFAQNVRSQEKRDAATEDEIKLSGILKKDAEFSTVNCRPETQPNDAGTDFKLKSNAYRAIGEAQGKSKLKKKCSTIEGDPAYLYLMIEKGKASLIIDTLEDRFGPQRVRTYPCGEFDIGVYFYDKKSGKMIFRKNEIGEVKEKQIVLRCSADSEELFSDAVSIS